jgi:cell division protein ZapA
MAEIAVKINHRDYKVACPDGQEERLRRLAAYLDKKVSELAANAPSGPVPSEAQLLVIASLMIADELGEANDALLAARSAPPQVKEVPDPASLRVADEARAKAAAAEARLAEAQAAEDKLAEGIEALAGRLERMTERLERT